MKRLLAGLALSAALVTGGAVATAPAQAAGIYLRVGDHHHHHWRHHHWRGYYWNNRYWHHRYHCWRWSHHHRYRGWCYR
jgi:hypothetical protein